MSVYSHSFICKTRGKGTYEITKAVTEIVEKSDVTYGTVSVFVAHTSASLILFENADPSARRDLHAFFERLCPEDDPLYQHTSEGPDDMPAHLKMALTRSSEVIPVVSGQMALGTWQGIFLFEHRQHTHERTIYVTVIGE